MALKLLYLSPEDARSPEKREEFMVTLNREEEDALRTANVPLAARLMPMVNLNVANDGSLFATVAYMTVSAMENGRPRPATMSEVERSLAAVRKSSNIGVEPGSAPSTGGARR